MKLAIITCLLSFVFASILCAPFKTTPQDFEYEDVTVKPHCYDYMLPLAAADYVLGGNDYYYPPPQYPPQYPPYAPYPYPGYVGPGYPGAIPGYAVVGSPPGYV